MARSNIHPDYHTVNVVMVNGETFLTKSTYTDSHAPSNEMPSILLDGDISTHPAWRLDNDASYINERVGNIAKFRQRRGSMSLAGAFAKKPATESDDKKD